MEITNFVTKSFISSFPGTLASVELIVFTTKEFPLIKKIPTKLYTFVLAIIHLIIVQVSIGKNDVTVELVYMLLINSLMVEVVLCGGYDTLMSKFNGIRDDLNQGQDINEVNNKISNNMTSNNMPSNHSVEVSKTTIKDIEK